MFGFCCAWISLLDQLFWEQIQKVGDVLLTKSLCLFADVLLSDIIGREVIVFVLQLLSLRLCHFRLCHLKV